MRRRITLTVDVARLKKAIQIAEAAIALRCSCVFPPFSVPVHAAGCFAKLHAADIQVLDDLYKRLLVKRKRRMSAKLTRSK